MPKGTSCCHRIQAVNKEDLEKIQSTKAVKRRDKNAEQNCYASKTHFLFIISQNKVALSEQEVQRHKHYLMQAVLREKKKRKRK